MNNLNPKSMPKMGYGTWNRPGDAAYRGVTEALEVGYRHIDCAEGYENEEFVGRALADSGLARDAVWITTKVAPESFGPGQIRPHVEASLEKLQIEQADLILLHYPSIGDEYDILDYMAQFAEVFDAGLTKHIGVSNFTIRYIDRALELLGDRKIATNQVELHPFLKNAPIVDHCTSKGIGMTAFSPLARGAVATDETLAKIGRSHGASAAQIALAYLMSQGHIVVPSAGHIDRITENFNAQEIALTPQEIAEIAALNRDERLINGSWCPQWDT